MVDQSESHPDAADHDPMANTLNRSRIAQTLKEARASLVNPSRPYTPADRSLFQRGDDLGASRPSSGYKINDLRFLRDTFAPSESMVSTRSSLRSQGSDFRPIPEGDEESGAADYIRFGDAGQTEEESHGMSQGSISKALRVPTCLPEDEEYDDGGAADELAVSSTSRPGTGVPDTPSLSMSRPATGSKVLTKEEEEVALETERAYQVSMADDKDYDNDASEDLAMQMEIQDSEDDSDEDASGPKAVKRPAPSDVPIKRPSNSRSEGNHRPRPRASGGGYASSQPPQAQPPRTVNSSENSCISELEALASANPPQKSLTAAVLFPITEKVWNHVQNLTSGDDNGGEAVGLLRAVLALMDRKDADVGCLLRLAKCVLELLQLGVVVEKVGAQGVQAAYLNIMKVLFKLSKDEANDASFSSEGLIAAVLSLLKSGLQDDCNSSETRVFATGILKNVSHSEENQRLLAKQDAIPVLLGMMACESFTGSSKEAQLLIQVTAVLRNMSASSRRHKLFLENNAFQCFTRVIAMYPTHVELLTNVSRVLAKLSLHDSPCEAFSSDVANVRQVTRILAHHADQPPLVLRLSFLLGNLTAKCDRTRKLFMFECDGLTLLPKLITQYWRRDRQLAQAEGDSVKGSDATECEGVLVKLIRLAANVAIGPSIGTLISSNTCVVDPLLDILGCKKIAESEELVLNAVAAVTNILFYDSPGNLLFAEENKRLLCRLLRPLLLESFNSEALVEASRALGNLSRQPDVRDLLRELRLDEVLAILLAHEDRDLVFYVCGALVNVAADPECCVRLCEECEVRGKLGAILCEAPSSDGELLVVAIKVLSNLCLNAEVECPWSVEELVSVRDGLRHILTLELGDSAPGLKDLAAGLDFSLPQVPEEYYAAHEEAIDQDQAADGP